MNRKGFSTIELLAVVIILTIITLISIPIVFNSINNQKKTQKRNSVNEYGENIKKSLDSYKSDHEGQITTDFNELKPYITVTNVECGIVKISEDEVITLNNCSVDGERVLDDFGEDYTYSSAK